MLQEKLEEEINLRQLRDKHITKLLKEKNAYKIKFQKLKLGVDVYPAQANMYVGGVH